MIREDPFHRPGKSAERIGFFASAIFFLFGAWGLLFLPRGQANVAISVILVLAACVRLVFALRDRRHRQVRRNEVADRLASHFDKVP